MLQGMAARSGGWRSPARRPRRALGRPGTAAQTGLEQCGPRAARLRAAPLTAECLLRGRVALGHLVPRDDVPPRLQVLGPTVLVRQVIGVLPDVVAEDRGLAGRDRAVLVR